MKRIRFFMLVVVAPGIIFGFCSYFNSLGEWEIADIDQPEEISEKLGLILYIQDLKAESENWVPIGIPERRRKVLVSFFKAETEQDLIGKKFHKKHAVRKNLPDIIREINKIIKEEREKQRSI